MFYHLAMKFKESYGFLNLFHYVSVRAIAALLSSLLCGSLLGNWFIRASQRNFRSKVRDWTPESHAKKNDTPTMGGLFILMIFFINMLLWNNLEKIEVWLFAACLALYGAIGFLDDWRKICREQGISARAKFGLQAAAGALLMLIWYFYGNADARLCVPFFKDLNPYLGLVLIPWGIFIMIGTSNAVNLTDGLDGLAAGPLMFNFSAFSIISYLAGHKLFAAYLNIPFTQTSELTICGASLIGGLLSFLWYNTYPAQIFMGDVGSLALGAALAFMALMTRQELLLLIAGGIFVAETLSVMIQVFSYKMWKKRVFKMAPIHHHFELLGWNEAKITVRFWIISMVLSLIALLILKVR